MPFNISRRLRISTILPASNFAANVPVKRLKIDWQNSRAVDKSIDFSASAESVEATGDDSFGSEALESIGNGTAAGGGSGNVADGVTSGALGAG